MRTSRVGASLAHLRAATPSRGGWLAVLDAVSTHDDVASADTALAGWPDELRVAPRGSWDAIQRGAPPPIWWPLVRAVALGPGDDLEPVRALSSVTVMDLGRDADRLDLWTLASLPSLRKVGLWGGVLTDLSPLAGLTGLLSLDIEGASLLTDLAPIAGLGRLEYLRLRGAAQLADLRPLSGLRLQTLLLGECASLDDLRPVAALAELRILHVDARGPADPSPISDLASLEDLTIDHLTRPLDLDFVAPLADLRALRIRDAPQLRDISGLRGLTVLREVELSNCPALTDLSVLVDLPALELVQLTGSPNASVPDDWGASGRVTVRR